MKIFICDDDNTELNSLNKAISSLTDIMDLQADIYSFGSGEALLSSLDDGIYPGICFLDIYLPGLSGVETAKILMQKSPNTALIFTTSSPDFYAEGFELGAVHYLLKPIQKEKLEAAFNRALKSLKTETRNVELTVNRQQVKIKLSDILYAETQGKLCNIYEKHKAEPLKTYMKLDELESLLGSSRFLRCHQSYIVNLDEVASPTEDDCFLMTNGRKAPIRKRSSRAIISQYNDYYFDKARRELQ